MNCSTAHAWTSHAFPRRTFLKQTLIAAGAAALQRPVASHAGDEAQPGLIDVNVHLSRWPTRRLPDDSIQALIARLRRNGVVQAWAGSFDESAVLKLQESELTTEQLQAIGRGNARRILSFANDKRASQAEQRG